MLNDVVITGLGLLTPLGTTPQTILRRISAGESAVTPLSFGAYVDPACPLCARIADFDPEPFIPEPKTMRLMNRDALLAAAAARMAIQDSGVVVGTHYAPQDVGLFGATGLAGVPLGEVARLIECSSDEAGQLDLHRFGEVALRQVRPVLSFKILSNMPLCFVSIFENLQGANAVSNPWEGQGAQAIVAGIKAIQQGDAACAVVGGCDVKTHELALIALKQHGVLSAPGCIPAEGAAFLVLESASQAATRGARIYARFRDYSLATLRHDRSTTYRRLLQRLHCTAFSTIVAAGDGDLPLRDAENQALLELGIRAENTIAPKLHTGNLFAAAASLQVGLAAALTARDNSRLPTLANCFGYGSEQAAFLLEAA